MNKFVFKILGSALLLTHLAVAQSTPPIEVDAYDPEAEVPQFSYVGQPSEELRKLGDQVRSHLVGTVRYWQRFGLKNPPDLQQIIVITDYASVRFDDLVQIFNPAIPDIRRHVAAQYNALIHSALGHLLILLDHKFPKYEGFLRRFFNTYAMVRYGYTSYDFADDIRKNPIAGEVKPSRQVPVTDNAFYCRGMRIDLTTILKKSPDLPENATIVDALKLALVELKKLQDEVGIEKLLKAKELRSMRIVILPRRTQKAGDDALSTLNDVTVSDHELSHHLNASIAEQLDRSVDEVFADYLSASPDEDPEIGKQFAEISGQVADRLEKDSGDETNTPQMKFRIERLKELASDAILRDLSELSTIDSVPRKFVIADPYVAGNPLRYFLWSLFADPEVSKEQMQPTVLRALKEFGQLPVLIPKSNSALITLRSLIHSFLNWGLTESNKKKVIEEQKGLAEDDVAFLATEKARASFEESEDRFVAAKKANKNSASNPRKVISADSVLPEFLRVFYRQAQKVSPTFAEKVRKAAEVAMNGKSLAVKSEDGSFQDLVFIRRFSHGWNPIYTWRAQQLLNHLERLRTDYVAFSGDESLSEEQKKQKTALQDEYSATLAHVHEFERTASGFRLFVAHPKLRIAAMTGKTAWNVTHGLLGGLGWALRTKKTAQSCEAIINAQKALLEINL